MILKDIPGYNGDYKISENGEVYSYKGLKTKKLKGGTFSNGYEFVCLIKNGKTKNCSRHRLVAETFIPNVDNKPVINHKDGNRKNNNVHNLEWCTQAYNLKHAIDTGLMESQCKIRRKVTVKQGEHIILFDTMKDCAAYFGFKRGWLQNLIRKHGCTFKYKDYLIKVHDRGWC